MTAIEIENISHGFNFDPIVYGVKGISLCSEKYHSLPTFFDRANILAVIHPYKTVGFTMLYMLLLNVFLVCLVSMLMKTQVLNNNLFRNLLRLVESQPDEIDFETKNLLKTAKVWWNFDTMQPNIDIMQQHAYLIKNNKAMEGVMAALKNAGATGSKDSHSLG